MADSPSFTAGGNISPSRFVSASGSFHVGQATGATNAPIGVSQAGVRRAPGTGLDDGYAAISGEGLRVFGVGETCLIDTGDVVTAGQYLKSDANGRAVPVDTSLTTLQYYGARALETNTASATKVRAVVILGAYEN